MQPKRSLITLILLSCLCIQVNAQQTTAAPDKASQDTTVHHTMNIFKVNLFALVFKNFSFQYERVLTKRVSVAFSYRFMPTSKIPFSNEFSKIASSDDVPETLDAIEKLRISNYAITPEVRFYLGKGYGKGFYIAFFYRYASVTVDHFSIKYDDNNSVDMTGSMTSNTGGILLGSQWSIGKHFSIDAVIFGPHYGSAKGSLVGVTSQPLTPSQQDELRKNLDDIDLPLVKKTVNVTANGGSLGLSGPWGGLRTGVSFGFRF